MKNLKLRSHFLYTLLFAVFLLLTSCSEWENSYDFRNYLRDKHPYSEITKVDLGYNFMYQVNDTINGKILIYHSGLEKRSVKFHCVNCK
jgi:hypothetical protein